MNKNPDIPRKIWLLWFQGLKDAPLVVKKCINSWKVNNPDWEITVLDSQNLDDFISLDLDQYQLSNFDLTKKSDLVRLELLHKYGGIWADATTYCMKPLDDWIHEYTDSGFFVFCTPGKHTLLSSWFIVAEQKCKVINEWLKFFKKFYQNNTFINKGKFRLKFRRLLSILLNKSSRTTRFWFSPIVTKILKVYPYYTIHYMFERVVSKNPECKHIWNNTKKFNSSIPHRLQKAGLFSEPGEEIKEEIKQRNVPVYKLTWKFDPKMYSEKTLLHYLLNESWKTQKSK